MRAVTCTSFSFLKIRAIFKQNDSCDLQIGANFKQQPSGARCFEEVVSKAENRSSLDIIDQTHPYQASSQTVRNFVALLFSLRFWQETLISSNS